jgi:peptide/nickel transport system permease protein
MRWISVWDRFSRNRVAAAGLVVLLVIVATSVAAPLLTSAHPTRSGAVRMSPPTTAHPFGTDDLGRDTLAGVLYGGRTSLLVGLISGAASAVLGVTIGGIAGYHRGLLDDVLMKITEIFMILPRFFVAILLVAVLGPSIWTVAFAIAILGWPSTARIARAGVLALKEREFVLASRALGQSDAWILAKGILPNVMPMVTVNTALLTSQAIISESGLSFLGLGDPTAVSYGILLFNAQSFMHLGLWWMSVFPGLALFLMVLGLNLAADGLNDALDPRQRTVVARRGKRRRGIAANRVDAGPGRDQPAPVLRR